VENKFEHNICAHTIEIYKGVPHFPAMFDEHKHLRIYATLKALHIRLSNLTKFDLLLCSSRFILATIEWCICIQALKMPAIEKAKLVSKKWNKYLKFDIQNMGINPGSTLEDTHMVLWLITSWEPGRCWTGVYLCWVLRMTKWYGRLSTKHDMAINTSHSKCNWPQTMLSSLPEVKFMLEVY
jgi:hypothetical protein